MAQRLIKVAKELNVGTSTIVDHLTKIGFEIDNKPTAKVSDEMYDELLKEFQGSIAVKEKADQLIIGSRISKAEVDIPTLDLNAPIDVPLPDLSFDLKPKAEEPVDPPVVEVPEVQIEIPAEEPEVIEEAPIEEIVEAKVDEEDRPKLKVVGKIDLEEGKKKAAKAKEEKIVEVPPVEPEAPVEPEVAKEPEVVEPEVVDVVEPESDTDSTEETTEAVEKEELIRAKTPQLQGLKILGKIDSSKLEPSRAQKKEKAEKEKAAAAEKKKKDKADKDKAAAAKKAKEDSEPKRKRRRTRRKVSPRDVKRGQDKRGSRDEVKEVTKKEIEEKIKATMARISGGSKSKRGSIRRDKRDKIREKQEQALQEQETGKLEVTEFITVSELASLMNVTATDVITICMNLGVIVSINQRLDAELIEVLTEEFGFEVEFISAEEHTIEEEEYEDDPADLEHRAPIVTVMGHVDHGKTSLLDYIRSANVASGEAGGITQHIGAYEVYVGEDKKRITFLDTPGHEAFTAMRARGAKVTDIAVVIIAADDNIMPQTKEAISHAQAAGVPIIFAINKIDKDGANPERIKQELASMNLLIEEWGGKFQSQDISAKTGLNIDLLLEKILLEAELLELKANPQRLSVGTVIEASLDRGRGYVTKILVQNGTLDIGDSIVAGSHSGKVKAMFNGKGKRVKHAGPSVPVLILGLSGAPQAGEKFKEMDTEQEARQLATKRAQIEREQTTRASKRISLDEIGRRLALGTFKELNLIVKGDVDGSVEALSDALIKLSQETVAVNVIHKAVGQITESDVLLASASDAIIIGFQVRPSMGARNLAEKEGVQIKSYSIIYEAIEEIKMAIEGMLEPDKEERITAQCEVREVFKISRIGTVAGCIVHEGKIMRNSSIRIIRDGIVIYPTKQGVVGELSTLKRYKDDVKEVKHGMECGITVRNFNDIKVSDMIEAYEIIEIKQTLNLK